MGKPSVRSAKSCQEVVRVIRKNIFFFARLALVVSCLLSPLALSAQTTPPNDGQGNTRFISTAIPYERLVVAVDTYAPKAVFESREEFLPCSVEDFLKATAPAPDNGLQIKDEGIKKGNLANAKAYVNIVIGESTTDIQYWFLYGYNGPGTAYLKKLNLVYSPSSPEEFGRYVSIGDFLMAPAGQHEGDWEHITVRIRNDNGEAQQVYFAAHSEGETKKHAETVKDGMITFHASRNGHAAYASADRHYSVTKKLGLLEFRLLDDTEKPGKAFVSRGKCVIIGAHEKGRDLLKEAGITFDWMKYTGRWGRVLTDKMGIPEGPFRTLLEETGAMEALAEFDVEKGPSPPWEKDSWKNPEF